MSRLSDLIAKQERTDTELREMRDLVEYMEQIVRDVAGTLTGQNKFVTLKSSRVIMDNSGVAINGTGTTAADTDLRALRLFNQNYNEHLSLNVYDKSGDDISGSLAMRGPGTTNRHPSMAYSFTFDDTNKDNFNHQQVIAPTSGNNVRLIFTLTDDSPTTTEIDFSIITAGNYAEGQGFDRRFDWGAAKIVKNDGGTFDIINETAGSSVSVKGCFFNLERGGELTIATGAITATQSYHTIDTQSDASTDDLDTINGGNTGDMLMLEAANGARTVVVKDGTGNLRTAGDFSMDTTHDRITFLMEGTDWFELARSNNA